MPLFYMFTWLLHPWGDGAFVLRLQSVVAGALAVLAIFWFGKTLYGLRAGLVAGVVMAVMPYAVWYSQEARNYALFMLLTTLQMYFAYLSIKRGRWFHWVGLGVFTTLNLYNHYLALETTAAVVIYVGGFLLADRLRTVSTRVRVVLLTALALAAITAAFVHWGPVLRSIYHTGSNLVLEAKTHRLASGLAAIALVGLLVMVIRWQARAIDRLLRRPGVERLALAVATGVAVAVAYLPWLPSLRVFVASPAKGLGRIQPSQGPNLGELASIPARLGLTWIILFALCAGLVTLGLWLFRHRVAEAGIVLAWLFVPLILLFVSVRWAITDVDLRYYAFQFPAATLAIGVGAEAIGVGLVNALRRISPRVAKRFTVGFATAVVGALLLAQALPALATSYQIPKNDWRGAAQHIAAASSPDSVVISMGAYSDWGVLCMQYYFRQLHSSITVVDGLQFTSDTIDQLSRTNGPTWAVVNHASNSQLALIQQSSTVKIDFVDVTGTIDVVRTTDKTASALEQAHQLLGLEQAIEPQVAASTGLLEVQSGQARLGPNLIDTSQVSSWLLSAGAHVGGDVVTLQPNSSAPEVNAFFVGSPPPAGETLMVSFEHRTQDFHGSQTLFAAAYNKQSQIITAFPSGSGYQSGVSDEWVSSYFGVVVPPGTMWLALLMRADGEGTAEFRSLSVHQILPSS